MVISDVYRTGNYAFVEDTEFCRKRFTLYGCVAIGLVHRLVHVVMHVVFVVNELQVGLGERQLLNHLVQGGLGFAVSEMDLYVLEHGVLLTS